MKKRTLLFVLLFQITLFAQTIEPAPADKAVVYFVRASGMGALINFTFFDSDQVIGRFNGPKYLRYECEPGDHILWARSENKDFVQASLEAGKIYVIDVIPVMGAIKAGVKLTPINSKAYKMKRIQKLLAKRDSESFSKSNLDQIQTQMEDVIARGMDKSKKLEGQMKSMNGTTFSPEELIFVKKK